MASKIRPLLQAFRGGCSSNSPRAACRAANTVRRVASKVRQDWPEVMMKGKTAYEACRAANTVRRVASKVRQDWPEVMMKGKTAYEAWRRTVKSGNEFIDLCHGTGRLLIFFGAPLVLVKVAYSEYARSGEFDPTSRYERTRATALEIIHFADPAVSRLISFLFLEWKSKPETDHDRDFTKHILREVDENYQEALPDLFEYLVEDYLKRLANKSRQKEEEEKPGAEMPSDYKGETSGEGQVRPAENVPLSPERKDEGGASGGESTNKAATGQTDAISKDTGKGEGQVRPAGGV